MRLFSTHVHEQCVLLVVPGCPQQYHICLSLLKVVVGPGSTEEIAPCSYFHCKKHFYQSTGNVMNISPVAYLHCRANPICTLEAERVDVGHVQNRGLFSCITNYIMFFLVLVNCPE
uniref:Uncharacterized protein n=1 Tax=Oryza brachyantha TaxID=4533 RepID=J3MVA6_ORYBR